MISYTRTTDLTASDFVDVLRRSGLDERRPVDDAERVGRMLANANLVIVARDEASGMIVGVARSLTDFAYACYLSDLAVDRAFQGQGIGQALIEQTRAAAGPQSMCLLVSAPDAAGFYERIGMPKSERAFLYPRQG